MKTRTTTSKLIALVALMAVWAWSAIGAQAQTPVQLQAEAQARAPRVTASAAAEQLRFAALGEVVQLRLEVFAASGAKLFDSDFKSGSLLDWPVHDQQGQRLADGAYLCVVTVKDLSGALSRQHGTVLLQAGEATLQAVAPLPLQPIQALEASQPFTILGGEATMPLTLLAHDENQGQLIGGRGALSFRTGDFFAGKDQEQMLLTAAGKLGLGVADPQAKLDVAGLIRTSEGIVFPDGTIQTTAFVTSGRSLSARARLQRDTQGRTVAEQDEKLETGLRLAPNISGSGTTNRVTKWLDGPAGVVGDSVISEVGGNVGIGTAAPQSGLDYRGSLAPFLTRDIGTTNFGTPQSAIQIGVTNTGSRNVNAGPSFLFFADNSAGAKSFLGRVSAAWENPMSGAEAGSLRFQVRANSGDTGASTERMRITSSGNVGIGTTSPAAKLQVVASVGTGVMGRGGSDNGDGVQGLSATGYGVRGESDRSYGVYGKTNIGGTTVAGVYGYSADAAGNGVIGEANGLSSYGVWGKSTQNRGVFGESSSGIGVFGKSNSGTGVRGESNAGNSDTQSPNVAGVHGLTTNGQYGIGVLGEGGFAGVYGFAIGGGWAGYFKGGVNVTGNFYVDGNKNFRIDHPLDPANKYLIHSCIESPDRMNIYNGNVTTDQNGEATVILPDYFEALNRDFRYQLTVLGQFAQAIVSSKVKDNRFIIKTDRPNVEVSWQVTGVRQDAHAKAHPMVVEVEKPERERGYYLRPELYGQPEEKSVEWARWPGLMRQMKERREQAQKQPPPKQ